MPTPDEPEAAIVSVPRDLLPDLETLGLAYGLPTVRGPVLEAVLEVGVNAATLVTLMQTPSAVRDFAAWVRGRASSTGESIELRTRRGKRKVTLRVEGDVPVDAVADFIRAALGGAGPVAPLDPGGPDDPDAA